MTKWDVSARVTLTVGVGYVGPPPLALGWRLKVERVAVDVREDPVPIVSSSPCPFHKRKEKQKCCCVARPPEMTERSASMHLLAGYRSHEYDDPRDWD